MRRARTQGYGVQSPTDFQFITKTLRADIPAPVREQLEKNKPSYKLCKLVYLVATDRKPHLIVNLTTLQEVEKAACMAHDGCSVGNEHNLEQADMVVADAAELCSDYAKTNDLLNKLSEVACLILRNINRDEDSRNLWQSIILHRKAVITYDLYTFGILFADSKRYRQHYEINF